MKAKIIIVLLSALVMIALGSYSLLGVIDLNNSLEESKQNVLNPLIESTNALEKTNKALLKQLEDEGKAALLSNADTAQLMSSASGGNLTNITALYYDGENLVEIVNTTEPDDIAFFTDTVDVIRYSFSITDKDAFLNSMQNIVVLQNGSHFDFEGMTAYVDVISASSIERGTVSYAINTTPADTQEELSVGNGESNNVSDDLGGELDLGE